MRQVRRTLYRLLVVGGMLLPRVAHSQDLCTLNSLGATGAWHVPTAALCDRKLLSFSLGAGYARTDGLTMATDHYGQWAIALHVTWNINRHWQAGLGALGERSVLTLPESTRTRGSSVTDLFVRYTRSLPADLEWAAMLQTGTPGAAPASEASGAYQLGLFSAVPSASRITPQASLTWRPEVLEATFHIGYSIDFSRNLVTGTPSAEQAAGLDIAAGNRLIVQAAVMHAFATRVPWLQAVPFLELGTAVPGDDRVNHASALLTIGGKALFGTNRFLEATLGLDVGIAGLAPEPVDIPALPNWNIFFQVAIKIERLVGSPNCLLDCPKPPPPPPPRVVTIIDTNALGPPVPGQVVDANSGAAVPEAVVRVNGLETVLAADPRTGMFTTWPLDRGRDSYVWTASAPGYLPASSTMRPRDAGPDTFIRIAMVPSLGIAPLTVRGVVRDDRTGDPIAAKIFITQTGQVIECDAEGAFSTSVRPGRLEVVISAPNHVTQKRNVRGGEGEAVILNVDLSPTRAHRGGPE